MAPLDASFRIGAAATALALSASLALAQAPAGTAAATTRVSSEAGVTIKVTPVALLPIGWMFAVVLDSQGASLDDNLQAQAVLVADSDQLKALEWDGSAAGGQHREGVLTFAVPQRELAMLEIRIRRNGEAAPRVFKWDRAELK
jgi:hypothetical protein